MLHLKPDQGLHLVLGSPAKEALGAFAAEDGAANVWSSAAYKRGDVLLSVLDSRPRVLLCLETARRSSSTSGGVIDVEDVWPLPRLIPVAAVEARLGHRLPAAPGPVPATLSQPLLDALEAELADPTPFISREGARCLTTSRARASGLQMVVLQRSAGFCYCCARGHLQLFGGKGLAALEVHHLRPLAGVEAEVETSPDELVAVCGACHNVLHSSIEPNVQDLRFEWRPGCPECRAKRAQPILWGSPAELPADDVVAAGCLVPERPAQWQCAECSYRWRDEDEPNDDEEGGEARQMLRDSWPVPREDGAVMGFGSDRFLLALQVQEAAMYAADFWTAEGGEFVEEVCPPGSMKDLCVALERALPAALLEEGKDPDAWRGPF